MKNSENVYQVNESDFNVYAANFVKEKLEEISKRKRIVNIALSGGSTPIPVLNILKNFTLEWDSYNFFLVDERIVDINSDESNFKNIYNVFYKHISSKSFPIIEENQSLKDTVINYKKQIESNVDCYNSEFPKFDLIVLGMGTDGHTASLFPNSEALLVNDDFVVENYIPKLNSYRVTLTYPVLMNCDDIIILIKGKDKLKIFNEINIGKGEHYPISKLVNSNLNWIIGK
jgi:6-phosphogluconolactonase